MQSKGECSTVTTDSKRLRFMRCHHHRQGGRELWAHVAMRSALCLAHRFTSLDCLK